MSDATETAKMPNLDECEFVMVSSTASEVSVTAPSRFRYRQSGGMIWGEYTGDTVSVGRFAGQRTGDQITINFAHALADHSGVVLGGGASEIVRAADGRMQLIEVFDKDGVEHRSVCVQVDSTESWNLPPKVEGDTLQLDGASFVLESSTASLVDSAAPTHFDFQERCGIVWGTYSGDTVTTGHSVGIRQGETLSESFVHELVREGGNETLSGNSTTRITKRTDGRLELLEEFMLDGVSGRSLCVQIKN
ncbi:hypothetical protein [Paeniglutamicibacter gangotriensis]|uniref:Uncharacterized protein n=1 Tax=Paeniglutamicibacter gangotriensis Lz1y TaxID=1276920 RepID=M7N4U6_9MICC|nr:hypothetical protein [Paeniglutamicibacter gangotriensis]EMQ96759.1 hypothetical protein ADIAG_03896 [Paeniglutamicibacter gangotriensis Lz1y]